MKALHHLLVFTAVVLLPVVVHAAPKPVRLYEVFVERFITDTSGVPIADYGLLNALGEFKHDIYAQLAAGTTLPPDVMNRNLVPYEIWLGYHLLGHDALLNFKFDASVEIGGQFYFVVAPVDHPKLDVGDVVNLSTRATVTPGDDPVIGGFVVEGSPRHVLIRGIGPGLSAYGVTTPLADPMITLHQQGVDQAITANDDWGTQPNVDAIEQAETQTSAFPVARTSKDAMLFLELQPGVYSVHLTAAGATGGTALLEVYTIP